jgi:hypothetical protein
MIPAGLARITSSSAGASVVAFGGSATTNVTATRNAAGQLTVVFVGNFPGVDGSCNHAFLIASPGGGLHSAGVQFNSCSTTQISFFLSSSDSNGVYVDFPANAALFLF